MLEILRDELTTLGAFNSPSNRIVASLTDTIAETNIPEKVKITIALSHLTNFAGQFRRNLELWDGTPVPINSISFIFLGSGGGKDLCNGAIKKCFSDAYKHINEVLEEETKAEAISLATKAGEDSPNLPQVYNDYLTPIPPLRTSITTGPGLVQLANDVSKLPLGSTFVYSGEFADELAHNANTTENIKILSEVYDLGNKEATYNKGIESRAGEINGASMSALFVSSPDQLLYDENTRKRFMVAFSSKLARRSWLAFHPEDVPAESFSSSKKLIAHVFETEKRSQVARDKTKLLVEDITNFGLETNNTLITLSDDIFGTFTIYKRYNYELVSKLPNKESIYALIRTHLQWKALKLAGALAFMDRSDVVELEHYVEAIRFCELLDRDMEAFETVLNKSPHEQFADYAKTTVVLHDDSSLPYSVITAHELKKRGFLTGVTKTKLQELVSLATGYNLDGVYTLHNNETSIRYEPIVKTDELVVSFKPIDNSRLNKAILDNEPTEVVSKIKQSIASTTSTGLVTEESTFSELIYLLQGDYAYSPFKFTNGTRGKDNVVGGTKWLVLDVDKSSLSYEEVHFMLSDINHHVALSSDPANEYKFRVLIELDATVELPNVDWKIFYSLIANDLAIVVDPLPQSQIFFSYAGRPTLSVTDATPLAVRPYLITTSETLVTKAKPTASLSTKQQSALLQDSLETFHYAFNAENGSGSRNLIRAAYHSQHLGASLDETLTLLQDVSNYWTVPMEESRLDKILSQVRRFYDN
jgi:hypothetical protein